MGNGKKFTYSFCTTTYKTGETIKEFIKPLLNSKYMDEIVIVDNLSNDGTLETLKNFGINPISIRCTRGKGRQIAIEHSKFEIIVMLDADLIYNGIDDIIKSFESSDKIDKLWVLNKKMKISEDDYYNISLVIGKKEIFQGLGGYPDLNYAEDGYIYRIAESCGLLYRFTIDESLISPLKIRGLGSGKIGRYNKNLIKKIYSRLIFTRDSIFVYGLNYKRMLEFYGLEARRKMILGLVLFVLGKLLTITIKDENPEERIRRVCHNKN